MYGGPPRRCGIHLLQTALCPKRAEIAMTSESHSGLRPEAAWNPFARLITT